MQAWTQKECTFQWKKNFYWNFYIEEKIAFCHDGILMRIRKIKYEEISTQI